MFSWARSSTTTTAGSTSPTPSHGVNNHASRTSRETHLSSYLHHPVLQPSTRKVSNDDTTYDTVFQTTNGFALILRVYAPHDMSSRAPSMSLHGVRASHEWLDIRMKIIGYGPIASDSVWKSSELKLGDAVYAVIHHFQLHPPSILEITDANLRRLQDSLSGGRSRPPPARNPTESADPPPYRDARSRPAQPPAQPATQPPAPEDEVHAMLPPVPNSFPEIDSLPLSRLEAIANQDSAAHAFADQLPPVATVRELHQSILDANAKAAADNLQHEQRLDHLRDDCNQLQNQLHANLTSYREYEAKRIAITRPPDVREVIRDLNKAKKEAYLKSEHIGEQWVENSKLAGDADVDHFVQQFLDLRMSYHLRAAKAERLAMSM